MKIYRPPLLVTALLCLCGCASEPNYDPYEDQSDSAPSERSAPPVAPVAAVVTLSQYQQIENGMSYSQVEGIIGSPGTQSSSSHADGGGVIPDTDTVTYDWQNSDGSNMTAMFQNDQMMMKAQAGLR